MKTLYFECAMGASGDMLAGALSELIPNQKEFIENINAAGLPDETRISVQECEKCGIYGTRLVVTVGGLEEHEHREHLHCGQSGHEHSHDGCREIPHAHSTPAHVGARIDRLKVNNKVKADIKAVYKILAEAESFVHKTDIEHIHFHETGTADALADITSVCMLIDMLSSERILCSPINTGSGRVHCAHGILPVPAPACARILRNIPVYSNGIQSELCTPTGAALLAHFASDFVAMPPMTYSAIGYGMGKKNFEQANCLRAFWGESTEGAAHIEQIIELSCNIDDMTGEALAFAAEILFENGALDVFTTPIGMKKSRPAVMLSCLCLPADSSRITDLIFRHTGTLGVREKTCLRRKLPRSEHTIETPYGSVRIKTAQSEGIKKSKIEYEDAARIARSQNISLADVYRNIEKTIGFQ